MSIEVVTLTAEQRAVLARMCHLSILELHETSLAERAICAFLVLHQLAEKVAFNGRFTGWAPLVQLPRGPQ
jgi:hypothetical protein